MRVWNVACVGVQLHTDKRSRVCASRLGFWQKLPWSLVQLAVWDIARARRAGRALIEAFDSAIETPELHHPLTLKFLSKSSKKFQKELYN